VPTRYGRHVRIEQLGEPAVTARGRVALILTLPALSLLLPALAVVIADSGGNSAPVRVSADIERFLLFYSGVFALVALTAAVGAGLLATDRIVMTPELRILSQGLHRMMSLVALSALANHIMLEVIAHRANVIDGFVPFLAVRRTFFMGLGTLASDLLIVVIVTGVLRNRFSGISRRWTWRALHATSYAMWPLAILHGLLAGRPAEPYVDWSYGAGMAAVGFALALRLLLPARGKNAADGMLLRRPSPPPVQPPIAQPFPRFSGPNPAPVMLPASRMSPGSPRLPRRAGPPGPPRRAPLPALPAGSGAPVPRPGQGSAPNWPLPDYNADWPSGPLPDYNADWPSGPLPDYNADWPSWPSRDA
jgi:hypothetical protein